MMDDYSLGYVRGLADTHGSLHLIGVKKKNQRAATVRSLDEAALDELAKHLNILDFDLKCYSQAPLEGKQRQHFVRILKQEEVRRFCQVVGFRRTDRAERAKRYLARSMPMVGHVTSGPDS